MQILFRPLLVTGMLGHGRCGPMVLIDSEMPECEQAIALFHELLHHIGLRDEARVEAMAQRLAAACPEIVAEVKALQGAVQP